MSQPAEQRAGKPVMLKDKDFQWEDPLDLEGELSEEERMVRDTARGFAQDYLMPRVIAAYRDETYDANMLPASRFVGFTLQYPLRQRETVPLRSTLTFSVWQVPSSDGGGAYPST